MRRAARVDPNQGAIVTALRSVGATVQPLHTVGDGCPDLVVGWRGANFLLEVKEQPGVKGGSSKKGQRLNEDQERWHREWRGQRAVVRTIDDAFDAIGVPRCAREAV